jgi:membrane protease YdiL (CAAX protease family)
MMVRMAAAPPPQTTPGRSAGAALARLAAVYLLLSLPAILWPLPRTLAAATALAALQTAVMVPILLFGAARAAVDWRLHARDVGEALLIAAAMVTALAALGALLNAAPESFSGTLRRGHRWQLQHAGQIPLAAAFVVTGAYREESYFRAYFVTLFRSTGAPRWLTTLASALLFGAGHLYQGWAAAGFAVLMGAALAYLFQQRPSLHRVVIAHALFNGLVLAATLIPPGALFSPGPSNTPETLFGG